MLIRLLVWLLERAAELLLGAFLSLATFGRSDFPPGATDWQELRLNLIGVSFFMIGSGYIVSCAGLGLRATRPKPVSYGILMSLVFVGHVLLFFLVAGADLPPLVLVATGAFVVGMVNVTGAALLVRLAKVTLNRQ